MAAGWGHLPRCPVFRQEERERHPARFVLRKARSGCLSLSSLRTAGAGQVAIPRRPRYSAPGVGGGTSPATDFIMCPVSPGGTIPARDMETAIHILPGTWLSSVPGFTLRSTLSLYTCKPRAFAPGYNSREIVGLPTRSCHCSSTNNTFISFPYRAGAEAQYGTGRGIPAGRRGGRAVTPPERASQGAKRAGGVTALPPRHPIGTSS